MSKALKIRTVAETRKPMGTEEGSTYAEYVKGTFKREHGYRGILYTTQEIADLLGVHKNTVKRWRDYPDAPKPTFPEVRLGASRTNLYTASDLKKLKVYNGEG